MKKNATIKDVARLSGFGISVVSYVLNNSPNISVKPETRQRILDAAAKLNYTPNSSARNMRKGSPYAIGLLSSWDITDTSEILNDVLSAASNKMYSVVLCPYNKDRCFDYIRLYQSKTISGVIIIPPSVDNEWFCLNDHIKAISDNGIPAVIFSGRELKQNVNQIIFDYERSAKSAVEYLLSLNHKKIAFIGPETGDLKDDYVNKRYLSYKETMRKNGLEDRLIRFSELDKILEDLKAPDVPTALIVAKAETAHLILQLAYKRRVRIPDSISLISCNYSNRNLYSEPRLTSIAVDAGNPGLRAAKILFSKIENPEIEPVQFTLPCELNEGDSCAAL